MEKSGLPALEGGKPVRDRSIPYARQCIDDDDLRAVNDVLRGELITTGPKVEEFEEALASYVGAEYAVCFSSGTAALHAACYAAGIGNGDEVITTPITFAATSNCVLYMGAAPVFADIDIATFNIDVKEIEKKITPRTKAVIPVDFTGQAVDIDAIKELVEGTGIVLIEDSAHGLGTKYKGKPLGGLADMTEFSFHPVKTITTGEGGAITANDRAHRRKLINFRSHCITRDPAQMLNKDGGPWYYEQLDLGFNYKLTDIQAALGISQLRKISSFVTRRKQIVNAYNESFRNLEGVILQVNPDFSDTSNHLYVLRLELDKLKAGRRVIVEALLAENIGVHVHYIPVYWHPYYRKLGYKKGLCPLAEELYNSMVTLPLFPAMTDSEVGDVIRGVFKIIDYYRK